jgi:hypothetical protein
VPYVRPKSNIFLHLEPIIHTLDVITTSYLIHLPCSSLGAWVIIATVAGCIFHVYIPLKTYLSFDRSLHSLGVFIIFFQGNETFTVTGQSSEKINGGYAPLSNIYNLHWMNYNCSQVSSRKAFPYVTALLVTFTVSSRVISSQRCPR